MTSKIKVDNINKVSDDSNIINKCGTTITLGASGDSIALASGATQTGFGRSGSVNWQTTPKTATFTAADGEGYFINSGSALTANLPAGSAGAIVAFSDYARNFETYNLTISPNGSEKIGGFATDAVLNVNGQAATFVYVDSTQGWVNVQNAEDTETGVPPFMEATGGTITEDGNFKVHTFTGPGTFQVTKLATQSPAPAHNIVSYTVAAGGGSGGGTGTTTHLGGGGGAGGFREGKNAPVDSYTASPLNAPAGLPVSVTSYPITVGAGGTSPGSGPVPGGSGNVSTFSTITSAGGGGGGSLGVPGCSIPRAGNPGGSGGGGSSQIGACHGNGNTPPTSPPQGQNGGGGTDAPPDLRGGSGGGATVNGSSGSPVANQGAGGTGATTNISGSPLGYSGGAGSGGTTSGGPGAGGAASSCGSGAPGGSSSSPTGVAAASNRAGGGGGAAGNPSNSANTLGGNGGSGVVIIRYKFQ
jgi:hypothetical protein